MGFHKDPKISPLRGFTTRKSFSILSLQRTAAKLEQTNYVDFMSDELVEGLRVSFD